MSQNVLNYHTVLAVLLYEDLKAFGICQKTVKEIDFRLGLHMIGRWRKLKKGKNPPANSFSIFFSIVTVMLTHPNEVLPEARSIFKRWIAIVRLSIPILDPVFSILEDDTTQQRLFCRGIFQFCCFCTVW